jgi:N-acetyl-gamma-glutamyl-phosphate reductase
VTARVGLVGARGHTGAELVRLIDRHPGLTLACAGSRRLAGRAVGEHFGVETALRFEHLTPDSLPVQDLDVVVLALPNGEAAPWVAAIDAAGGESDGGPVVVDLSADYRFDSAWYYGLPELTAARYRGERRIANPGCYATAMQLAIAPLRARLAHAPSCFGVSGYSGAGTRPSRRNDPQVLRDNLLPYGLAGHLHEREVTAQLDYPVAFCPHVASFFRGICLTAVLWLDRPCTAQEACAAYAAFYADAPLVEVTEGVPEVRDVAGRPGAVVGGFAGDAGQRRLTVVCVLDNLLKGAAVQAVQNINTGLGAPPLEGLASAEEDGS